MKVSVACDHRGYEAKELIKSILQRAGHDVLDFGANETKSSDYPDFAIPASLAVSQGEADRGILICGSGIGMCITANKVPGIRAALVHDELTAKVSRQHNDANVLCLPAMLINNPLVNKIVETWLTTEFEGGRHERRVKKMMEAEKLHLRLAQGGVHGGDVPAPGSSENDRDAGCDCGCRCGG